MGEKPTVNKKSEKTKEKCEQQNSAESVSDTETSTSILKCVRLDMYYQSGNKFQFTFIHKVLDSTKRKKVEKDLGNV